MELQQIFEEGIGKGLFTDYHFSTLGRITLSFRGGQHVSTGSYLFDIASLTKACNHLLFLRLFNDKKIDPESYFRDFISVPSDNGRKIWHFLCYLVKDYNFGYESLRAGNNGKFKEVLLNSGFGFWGKRFQYDNISSAYLAFLLEKYFDCGIEEIFQKLLMSSKNLSGKLMFHPVSRHGLSPEIVVPTKPNVELRGLVHDPLSFHHRDENIAVAGLFSDADTLARIFHDAIAELIASGFYDEVSRNQLEKIGIIDHRYALGFDIPYPFPDALRGCSVEKPLLFAGWTGCRIFFCKNPRLTICFLTNRVYWEDTSESRQLFSKFSWKIIREVIDEAAK